jgi:hypothetical protein
MRRLAYSHRTLISCQWVFGVGDNTCATIAVWRTSSYSGCRQREHSYHASSGSGLEGTKTEDAFVIEREKQTLYILEADIGEREGTVTINRQKSRLLEKRPTPSSHQQGLPWPVARSTRKRPVTGSCGDSNVTIDVPVYLINPAKSWG